MENRIWMVAGLVVLAGAMLWVSCRKSNNMNNENPENADAVIHLKNAAYNPADITLSPSSTVLWINDDNMVHSVTSDDGLFNSGDMNPGDRFTYTFDSTGTFHYHCVLHASMKGVVKIVMR